MKLNQGSDNVEIITQKLVKLQGNKEKAMLKYQNQWQSQALYSPQQCCHYWRVAIVISCKSKFKLKLHAIKELNMLKDSELTEASMPTEIPTKETKGQDSPYSTVTE